MDTILIKINQKESSHVSVADLFEEVGKGYSASVELSNVIATAISSLGG